MARQITRPGFPQELFTVSVGEDGSVSLVAEASDLGPRWLTRVYPDACDAGLIVNTKRGNSIQYVAADLNLDREGDVTSWVLHPSPESLREVPACAGTSVVVFND